MGFLTKEEREMFNILNEVSGIGPRSSISIIFYGY
jgi:Holliday junction resolvasome RuvABC DNA-binding subunit